MSPGHWLAVASAEHVRIRPGRGGFMQVCHGKAGPLRRIGAGAGVVYYSPAIVMGGKDGFKSFIAIGRVCAGEPNRFDGGGFQPFRRDVDWAASRETPVAMLLGQLDFTASRNWGYQLRFGLCPLSEHDFRLIAEAMGVEKGVQVFGLSVL